MENSKSYDLYLIFGEDASNAIYDGGFNHLKSRIKEGISFDLIHRHFETKGERDAYLMALEDSNGWYGFAKVSKDQYEKIYKIAL